MSFQDEKHIEINTVNGPSIPDGDRPRCHNDVANGEFVRQPPSKTGQHKALRLELLDCPAGRLLGSFVPDAGLDRNRVGARIHKDGNVPIIGKTLAAEEPAEDLELSGNRGQKQPASFQSSLTSLGIKSHCNLPISCVADTQS